MLETYLQRIFDRLDELEVREVVRYNTNNNTIAGQTAGTATAAKAEAAAAATKRREANQEAQRVHTQPALFEEETIANRSTRRATTQFVL
jgi:ribosomal protein L12E/L44/L45/RPP1/RPP2